jgi:Protein of unknown function (DUF998)
VADGRTRAAALVAAGCVVGGATAVIVALLGGAGPKPIKYVSEAGAEGSPYAPAYQGGMYAMAAGLVLLAVALRPAARPAAALLAAGAAATTLSGTVPCTEGCPLPPYEPTTPADLVHAAASIVAVAAWVFAIVATAAAAGVASGVRRFSAGAAALALPLSVAVGVAILVAGRGSVVSIVERLLLVVTVVWAVGAATAIGMDDAGPSSAAP